jgi:hypothetical protein
MVSGLFFDLLKFFLDGVQLSLQGRGLKLQGCFIAVPWEGGNGAHGRPVIHVSPSIKPVGIKKATPARSAALECATLPVGTTEG